mgnify:CR=1 FL=1
MGLAAGDTLTLAHSQGHDFVMQISTADLLAAFSKVEAQLNLGERRQQLLHLLKAGKQGSPGASGVLLCTTYYKAFAGHLLA